VTFSLSDHKGPSSEWISQASSHQPLHASYPGTKKLHQTTTYLHTSHIMASLKGPGEAQQHDGSALRIGIVHARWNTSQSLLLRDVVDGTLIRSSNNRAPRRGHKSQTLSFRSQGIEHRRAIRTRLLGITYSLLQVRGPSSTPPPEHS
jgi:hypothetical protein